MKIKILCNNDSKYKIQIKDHIFSSWRDAKIRTYNNITGDYYEDIVMFNSWNKAFMMAYEINNRRNEKNHKSSVEGWKTVMVF
uniref:Uncharacterized protein n=1 Tax=viral metagenome TaxID=1070528 RepID=A0A6M3IL22_9ZZZZ